MLNEYYRAVLRHHAYPSRNSGVTPGSGEFIKATEHLTKLGYISGDQITTKGAQVMVYPPP